ncbi:hypothetical protein [Synechococcus sp. LTW-G]
MPDQVESWIALNDRTEELQMAVAKVSAELGMGSDMADNLYVDMNWGSIANHVLITALYDMQRTGELQDASEILAQRPSAPQAPSNGPGVHEEEQEPPESWIRRREAVITKDLSWFINNGETADIRLKAKEYREQVLMDLYLEHVKMSGETYFPELHRLLKAEWDFSVEQSAGN